MLSGLFQIDVSVVMAVSLVPQEAILTSQRSKQLETVRPGSSSRPKTWSVGHSARQSKLTKGTQTRVGRGRAAYLSSTCSLCAPLHWVWYKLSRSFISHAWFYSHFIDIEMGGQRVWNGLARVRWQEMVRARVRLGRFGARPSSLICGAVIQGRVWWTYWCWCCKYIRWEQCLPFAQRVINPFLWYEGLNLEPHTYIG